MRISAIALRMLTGRGSVMGSSCVPLDAGHTLTWHKRLLSVNPRDLKKMDRQKYTVFIGPALFCALMYVCYIKEYEDKESVADYLKSDKLKEDAKQAYGMKRDR